MPEEIPIPTSMSDRPGVTPLRLKLSRMPFMSFITLTFEDGSSEDMEIDEAEAWLKVRGAKVEVLEQVLSHVWNFYKAELTIRFPKQPPVIQSRVAPRL